VMATWQLGIDFGTSYTVAATETAGTVAVVDVESDGRARIPSAVLLNDDGTLLTGMQAQDEAVFAPECYEPTPTRLLGEGTLVLGDQELPITDLVAAVLRRVYVGACRQRGESVPSAVRLTHPAGWSKFRLDLLREAAAKAGL